MPTATAVKKPISSEKTEWGVQLRIHPFEGITGARNSAMTIQANVERPKKNRRAEIRIWFSGVLGGASLSLGETVIWQNALRGLLDEAQRVGATMKPKRAKAG